MKLALAVLLSASQASAQRLVPAAVPVPLAPALTMSGFEPLQAPLGLTLLEPLAPLPAPLAVPEALPALGGAPEQGARAELEARAEQVRDAFLGRPSLRRLLADWNPEKPLEAQDALAGRDEASNRRFYPWSEPEVDTQGHATRVGWQAPFLILSMRRQFVGEDEGKIPTVTGSVMVYLRSEEARRPYAAVVEAGRLFNARGYALHGVYNLVLAPDGTLYVAEPGSDFGHASLAGGGPVASAGMLAAHDGTVVGLSMNTGHYGITEVYYAQALLEFERLGIRLDDAVTVPVIPLTALNDRLRDYGQEAAGRSK